MSRTEREDNSGPSMNTNVVVIEQRQTPEFGFVALMIVCGIVALIIKYFWFILAGAALAVVLMLVWKSSQQLVARDRRLAAQAELQNRQVHTGDPRGTYGDFDEAHRQDVPPALPQ